MKSVDWKVGDWAIYRKQKRSGSPGPRATAVYPDEHGDSYTYVVDKYWIVEAITDSGELQLVTRTGKRHTVAADDHRLRPPRWWERWTLAGRFRNVEQLRDSQ